MADENLAQVYLYLNNSDPKRAWKSLTKEHRFESNAFSLKDPVDVLNPVLLIKKSSVGSDWQVLNYAWIPKFGNRYYFAKYVTQRGELLEYQLNVDVLMTYKSALVQQSYEIERCESNKASSLKFADAERPMQADKWIVADVIGNLDQLTGGIYTLTVAGGAASP